MRVALLGLGLIGGSIGRALRTPAAGPEPHHLTAWTPGGAGPRAAVEAGIIDVAAPDPGQALVDADLVILAAPPLACEALIVRLGGDLAPFLAPGATVTDVASTKSRLLASARDTGVAYVGGHPMAGRETSGFGAADADLFRDRPWVIGEAVNGGDRERVRALAVACGACPLELGAEEHDRLVAAISHLPLVAAVALVEAVAGVDGRPAEDWPAAALLAASGWQGATRLARGDVTMGTEIAVTNAAALAGRLRAYRDRLDAWVEMLEAPGGPDEASIRAALAAARATLEV
jgi:prephenate dehydrogenase